MIRASGMSTAPVVDVAPASSGPAFPLLVHSVQVKAAALFSVLNTIQMYGILSALRCLCRLALPKPPCPCCRVLTNVGWTMPRSVTTCWTLGIPGVLARPGRFFIGQGFDRVHWTHLQRALMAHGAMNQAQMAQSGGHVEVWCVVGPLETPSGKRPLVLSVWVVDDGSAPRFITAYPR